MTTVALGDLLKPAKVKRAGGGTFPLLSMTMHGGLVDQSAKFKKRVASSDVSDYKVIKQGQLVVGFPIDEGVLDFQMLYSEGIVSPAYGVWDLATETLVHRPYLKKFLRSGPALAYYEGKLRGSTARRRSLPAEVFLALPIPLPPVDEQRRIAAILDHADALRGRRRQVLAHLDTLARSIFRAMFAGSTWPGEPLSAIVQAGTIVTYGIVQAGDEFDGGVPYIRTGDIVAGEIVTAGLRHTDPAIAARFQRSAVSAGDIVMSIRATVGTTAVVPSALDGANLTQGTARIAPSDRAIGSYLLGYLRSDPAQRWIHAQVKGATFREITLGRLRELQVPLPPVSLQHQFAKRLACVNSQTAHTRRALEVDDQLLASLQARAFRGGL